MIRIGVVVKMQDFDFGTTVLIIIIFAFLVAFIRGRVRDKCLKEFSGNFVTLEFTNKRTISGKLRVEISGMEFIYRCTCIDSDGHEEYSYLLYKGEYSNIQALIRFHDELEDNDKEEREKELKRTYHPNIFRRLKRKISNVFKTVRDSIMDMLNLFVAQVKRNPRLGSVLQSQDAYVTQIKKELVGYVGATSYDPLLERHIGNMVIFEMIKSGNIIEYSGVLKDYSDEFIEFMDVRYSISEDGELRKADLVIPRKIATVRHSAE